MPTSPLILELLLDQRVDWTSPTWRPRFSYFRSGLASSTQSSYKAGLKRFYDFCVRYNIPTPFPVTEQILCYFLAFLADQGLAPKPSQSYLSAVCSMQISLGFPDPRDPSSMPILKRVQAGIRRVTASKDHRLVFTL